MQFPSVEKVAAEVHAAWMESKREQGIESHVDRLTGEELMRPYEELSERQKDVDRRTVVTVYKAILAVLDQDRAG